MQRDIRETELYLETERLFTKLRRPGSGLISDAAEVHASSDGRYAVFSGTLMDRLEGAPSTRICRVDLSSGDTRVLTFGPYTDRLPKYSPDGGKVAFLSDRHREGDFQLYLLDPLSGAVRSTASVDGWVEYLHWSPDGGRILLGVAGHGADVSGGQGAVKSKRISAAPSWMPVVELGDENYRWRRVWVYELANDRVHPIGPAELNVWEAAWCGKDAVAAVASPGPGEGLWYSARLHLLELETGRSRELYTPKDQLGWPAASPSGQHLAIVEALCSDRYLVAGSAHLIDIHSGRSQVLDTHGVDVTCTEWCSNEKLLLTGHRGLDTVISLCQVTSGAVTAVWKSSDPTTGGIYATVSAINDRGDCVLEAEGFTRAPEIAAIRGGKYQTIRSFDTGYAEEAKAIGAVEQITWHAPDGLEIQGWLLTPKADNPLPIVMALHGGPVWHTRPFWLGRGSAALMLLKRGYAIFYPNPRGSSGRGQDFARLVLGEMGGAEAHDHLSGLDHLVERGIADPKRLGVTGGSYGGFMTSWLITQDSRFAAAVSVAPHTNQVSEHLISNIPHFTDLFLADRFQNPGGNYFFRSPVMHAHRVQTPTLNICGALDRCTPPEEAVQFHSALLEAGVTSVLLTYPKEGHGIRKFPAVIDYVARIVAWLEEHMPPDRTG